MKTDETIAAIASGTNGAISIVRISGENALETANRVWRGKHVLSAQYARQMLLGYVGNDRALAVYMPNPASYTGEDVVELHTHGGLFAAREALDAVLDAGARMAEPGEFTFRAFVNGKMDLAQAEAVGDLLTAGSTRALHLAERQLAGALSERIQNARDRLLTLLAECESRLDFPEEELDWASPEAMAGELESMRRSLAELLGNCHETMLLRSGVQLVIAGRPNAGKSSLLNALLGCERAIVTDIPGTTRDTLEESFELRGIPVRLTDTAGLRESNDPIEQLGVARSRQSIAGAEIIFWLLDASAPDLDAEIAAMPHADGRMIAVWNKTDLIGDRALPEQACATVRISARTRTGLEQLLDRFEEQLQLSTSREELDVAVNARHGQLIRECCSKLEESAATLRSQEFELAAIGLHAALHNLGRVLGEAADPDILEDIFSRFCIGK